MSPASGGGSAGNSPIQSAGGSTVTDPNANASSGGSSSNGGALSSAGSAASGGEMSSGSSNGGGGAGAATGGSGNGGERSPPANLPPLVTSTTNAYWKTDGSLTDSTAAAIVTVDATLTGQTWDGFGGAFNELGWAYLTTPELQLEAMKLLFSAVDGANLAWGRVPIGASDYAVRRYTLDDNAGENPAPNQGETNRPDGGTPKLAKFSLDHDKERLIPYIKAAQAVKPELRFWASPWTPPVWMKTGFKTTDGQGQPLGSGGKPSYYDGGTVRDSADNFTAYAEYYKRFIQGYEQLGIHVEVVSPQNEPGYEQNYPSALWDAATYVKWINKLGPTMKELDVKVMLGTLSNRSDYDRSDLSLSTAVLADATAKGLVSMVGVQWNVLQAVVDGQTFNGLPIWATEHKCGNYPWCKAAGDGCPAAYFAAYAPNDHAYGVESWGYIRDAIKAGVTAYSAWNMVLDKVGWGIDTSREWSQDSLLVVDGGKVIATPAYFVFRHLSQYVAPQSTVLKAMGGDAVAFENPDGSLVAVMYNGGAANPSYVVSMGGKKLQFAMPANGWATVKYKP